MSKAARARPARSADVRPVPAPGLAAVRRPWWRRLHSPLTYLLAAVAVFHVLTMPRFYYAGDNFSPRAEGAHFLNTGQLGIPYAKRAELGPIDKRGQNYFENDARQRLFSKWGLGNTALYLPPLIAEKLYASRLDLVCVTDSLLLFINLYQVLFTVLVAAYLYRIAAFYTPRAWVRVLFLLACFYTTYLWHYLRSPTNEILQILPFVGSCYHLLHYLRETRRLEPGARRPWRHLTYACLWAGLLVLTKLFFAVVFATVWLFAALAGSGAEPLWRRVWRNVSQHAPRHLLHLGLPSAVVVAILLGANAYRFGGPFETGYWQELAADGLPFGRFGLRYLKQSLPRFLWKIGNMNVFLHYPLFLFALFALPRFVRRNPLDAVFVGFTALANAAVICLYSCWAGEWCYGPRLLLPFLVLLSLPFVHVLEFLFSRRLAVLKVSIAGLMALVLAWSLKMQMNVNALNYFVYYQLRGGFQSLKDDKVSAYFGRPCHRGLLHADIIAHVKGRRMFPPVRLALELVPRSQRKAALQKLNTFMAQNGAPNYFFFRRW